jgi:hypothetical protein
MQRTQLQLKYSTHTHTTTVLPALHATIRRTQSETAQQEQNSIDQL